MNSTADELVELTKQSRAFRPGMVRRLARTIPMLRRALKGHEFLEAAADVGGLGILAAPHLPSTKLKKGKKRTAVGKWLQSPEGVRTTELAGLGLLAVPSAISIVNQLRVRVPQAAQTLGKVL